MGAFAIGEKKDKKGNVGYFKYTVFAAHSEIGVIIFNANYANDYFGFN